MLFVVSGLLTGTHISVCFVSITVNTYRQSLLYTAPMLIETCAYWSCGLPLHDSEIMVSVNVVKQGLCDAKTISDQIQKLEISLTDCLKINGLPGGAVVKNPPASAGDTRDVGLILGWKIPWSGKQQWVTNSCILAWKIPWTEESGRLYSLWGYKHDWGQSDTTELLSMDTLH